MDGLALGVRGLGGGDPIVGADPSTSTSRRTVITIVVGGNGASVGTGAGGAPVGGIVGGAHVVVTGTTSTAASASEGKSGPIIAVTATNAMPETTPVTALETGAFVHGFR